MGEDILEAGEILIGIDLDGDEPGEVSKCILVVYGVGQDVYVYTAQLRALSAGKAFGRIHVVFAI